MPDDPILTAIARLEATQERIKLGQEHLMSQLNTKLDDILDKISAIRQDTDTVRGRILFGLQEI